MILSEANIAASARGMKGRSIGIELGEQESRAVIDEAIRQAAFQSLVWTVAATEVKATAPRTERPALVARAVSRVSHNCTGQCNWTFQRNARRAKPMDGLSQKGP